MIRSLIEKIRRVPINDRLEIELVGDIASMVALTLPEQQNAAPGGAAASARFRSSVKVVAGARNHRQHTIRVEV